MPSSCVLATDAPDSARASTASPDGALVAELRRFHGDWGYVAIVLNALAGIVAGIAWRKESWRGRWVWISTIVAEAALMLQVLIGVILVSSHKYTAPRFHMFYG